MQRRKQVQRAGLYRDDGKRYKTMALKTTTCNFLPTTISAHDVDIQAAMAKARVFKFPTVDVAELRLADSTCSVLSFDNVSARYQPLKTNVLSHVTLQLSMGSRVGIVGPNGAGKTTLLHIMSNTMPKELQIQSSSGKGENKKNVLGVHTCQKFLLYGRPI